jgi:hypothetical protein
MATRSRATLGLRHAAARPIILKRRRTGEEVKDSQDEDQDDENGDNPFPLPEEHPSTRKRQVRRSTGN